MGTEPSATAETHALLDAATSRPTDRASSLVAICTRRLCTLEPGVVNREIELRVLTSVATAWSWGWQPVELTRQVRRTTDALTVQVALVALAADHSRHAADTVDPRWAAQLVELALRPIIECAGWLGDWADATDTSRYDELRAAVALLRSLAGISRLPTLIPPPGATEGNERIVDLTAKTNDPMLRRVRALLAQAESTRFAEEAETFTAKAHELMARHAIDAAMIAAGTRNPEQTDSIRIAIDEPYLEAKSLLLHVVAESSRCRAVFHQRFAMSSVVGFATDLDATEALFTSLLVQAQIAMQGAAATAAPGTRTRSRSFRSAFLMAYAYRVAERLEEINRDVVTVAEAETGRSILPVLAARSVVVEAAVEAMFGRLHTTEVRRGFDAAGWASGHAAADHARLNQRDDSATALDRPA